MCACVYVCMWYYCTPVSFCSFDAFLRDSARELDLGRRFQPFHHLFDRPPVYRRNRDPCLQTSQQLNATADTKGEDKSAIKVETTWPR